MERKLNTCKAGRGKCHVLQIKDSFEKVSQMPWAIKGEGCTLSEAFKEMAERISEAHLRDLPGLCESVPVKSS